MSQFFSQDTILLSFYTLFIQILTFSGVADCDNDIKQGSSPGLDNSPRTNLGDERRFRILEVPSHCTHKKLTQCHANWDSHSFYQLYCFRGACKENEMYFCLEGTNNNTIHICGPTTGCKKRHQDIFTYDIHKHEKHLKVHSTECSVGYFQPAYFQKNYWNCFTKCLKDESVVIIQNATNDRPALARCNSQKNYCNGYNISHFEIGSSEDYCLLAMRDLKIKCDVEEELLPNCTCTMKCLPNTVRDWDKSFRCIPENTTQSTSRVVITEYVTKTTTSSNHQNTKITSQDSEDGKAGTNTNEDDIGKIHTVVTLSGEFIVLFIVLCLVTIGLIVWMVRKGKFSRVIHANADRRRTYEYNAETINFQNGADVPLTQNTSA